MSLTVRHIPPTLRSLELRGSANSSGDPSKNLGRLLAECDLEDVQRLKCAEGLAPIWDEALFPRWQSLTTLILGSCGLTLLPSMVRALQLDDAFEDAHDENGSVMAARSPLTSFCQLCGFSQTACS